MVPQRHGENEMATLHIEHEISDLETWLAAFGSFAQAREKGHVRTYRVYQPADDGKYIVIHLDFDTVDEAESFKTFLETNVWSNRESSPGLAGRPQTRVLELVLPR